MIWKDIKDFWNKQHRVSVITRKTYLTAINQSDTIGYTTPDVIRRYLTAAGYLEVIGRGRYKVLRRIPEDLTLNQLRRDAYRKQTPTEYAKLPYDEDFQK